MFNVGGGEFLIIFLVALVVLGPQKLPDAARQIGKIAGEFRRISSGFQREMQSALNDPVSKVTGEATPKSLTDVTKIADVKPIDDDGSTSAKADASGGDTEPPKSTAASDPFGNKTQSSAAPDATPSVENADSEARDVDPAEAATSAGSVSEVESTDHRPDEGSDNSMFGDR